MVNQFQEFGGQQIQSNPLSEFGGQVINNNPLAEFNGSLLTPPTNINAKKYYSNYMDSPIYKKRLNTQGIHTTPDISNVLNTHIMQINGGHSRAWDHDKSVKQKQSEDNQYPIDAGRSNINIDIPEINSYKEIFGHPESPEEVLAHELSHVSRYITPKEQAFIASKNQTKQGQTLYKRFLDDTNPNKGDDFSQYLFRHDDSGATHDFRPDESKADLDALRYMMFKKGIYDTSKRDMTIDDYNNAKKDSDINNSLEFNRLIKNFKPSDLILLNNTIASNNNVGNSMKNIA